MCFCFLPKFKPATQIGHIAHITYGSEKGHMGILLLRILALRELPDLKGQKLNVCFDENFCLSVCFQLQVSGRLSELKTTIDAGLVHRSNLLQTIGEQFEQWNLLVSKNS